MTNGTLYKGLWASWSHTCGGYRKSTRPYMKCVIWDRVHVVQHFTRWEWLEIRRLFQFLQSGCTNPMMTQVFHEWPESDSTTTMNFRQIISPSLWVKHNIKHGSHSRHARLHYYVTDSLTNAVPFTQHKMESCDVYGVSSFENAVICLVNNRTGLTREQTAAVWRCSAEGKTNIFTKMDSK